MMFVLFILCDALLYDIYTPPCIVTCMLRCVPYVLYHGRYSICRVYCVVCITLWYLYCTVRVDCVLCCVVCVVYCDI